MRADETTEPIPIRTSTDVLNRIDALAVATDRSRNELVDDAPRLFLETNVWQIGRIDEGLAAARDGRFRPVEDVLAKIAAKHGFARLCMSFSPSRRHCRKMFQEPLSSRVISILPMNEHRNIEGIQIYEIDRNIFKLHFHWCTADAVKESYKACGAESISD